MRTKTSQAEEDYLKAIYTLTRGSERASTNEIAGQMNVSPASATGMIQRLASTQPPLLLYEKHHGATLTSQGEQVALEVIRHHRLLETFLKEILGYTWDEVHAEADKLEHVISEQLEERIAQALGDPRVDPHGEPIPDREFQIPKQITIRLADLQPGDRATVARIEADDPGLLRYLSSLGLGLNAQVTVLDASPYDDTLQVRISGRDGTQVLGDRITSKVFVTLI